MTATPTPLPRVRLRALGPADLHTHADGCDDLVTRWTSEGRVSSREEHLAWLVANAEAARDGAPVVDLAVEDADTGAHVGVVGIQRGMPYLAPGEVNLTYALYAGHRGRGYATAAVREAMRVAVAQQPVSLFLIRCDRANVRSGALARRLGFTYLGAVAEPDGWTGDRYALAPQALVASAGR